MSTLKFREAAPAYLEYAADLLANRQFRLMTFGERGLLSTMKYECWVNGSVPADPSKLARLLGEPPETMSQLLTPAVLDFFHEGLSPNGQVLICPDLEQYRLKLTERRNTQARAAAATNAKRRGKRDGDRDAKRDGDRDASATLSEWNGVELKGTETAKGADEEDEWVTDYEGAEEPPF